MHIQFYRQQSQPAFFNSTLVKALTTSLLILISVMLVIIALAFNAYQIQQQHLERQLRTAVTLMREPQQMLENEALMAALGGEHLTFFVPQALDSAISQQLKPDAVIFVPKKAVERLGWQIYGLNASTLIASVPNSDWLIATPISRGKINQQFMLAGLYLSLAILAIMLLFTFFIQTQSKRRLQTINEAAKSILQGNENKSIPINPAFSDEYTVLSETLNSVLQKNRQLMQDLRTVNSNIAHDLKSPLNRMRSRMEVALMNDVKAIDLKPVIEKSIEDVDGLLNTFQSLLLMGNLDAKTQRYALAPVSLSRMLEQLADLYEVVAEEANHTFSTDIQDNISVLADDRLFAQAISNLLDNAIKYTPEGGNIYLHLKRQGQTALVMIADNGPGIPASDRQQVFERFVRLDSARQLPGTGLGMSLVHAILLRHNASIQLHDNQPGLRVEIRLRVAPT